MQKYLLWALLFMASVATAQTESTPKDWQKAFEKRNVNGTFVLHEMNKDIYKTYNTKRSHQMYLPASTFKIINSLIALETGAISHVDKTIKWDGKDRSWDLWNKNHTMRTAITVSCVWFYQELARRIGTKKMQEYLKICDYGNQKMGKKLDTFWLEGDIRINARQQIAFLEKLIKNKLPFRLAHQKTVKEIIVTDSTNQYILHSKTGWAGDIGWFVGYVERGKKTWIFALNIDIKDNSYLKYRKEIVYEILKSEKIITK